MNFLHKQKNNEPFILLQLGINENGYEFASDIKTALSTTQGELEVVSSKLEKNLDSLNKLTPECIFGRKTRRVSDWRNYRYVVC